MTRILSIDASTEACSVALLDREQVTAQYQFAPRQHASLLLPMVEQLINDAKLSLSQLDGIACVIGPGAFTGIRIAVSVAQGLAYGVGRPVIGLSSLENLAIQGFEQTGKTQWLSAIDARMGEIYLGGFLVSEQSVRPLFDEQVISPVNVNFEHLQQLVELDSVGLIGSGWQAYAEPLLTDKLNSAQLLVDKYPSAKYSLMSAKRALLAGKVGAAEQLQPQYLRNQVAIKKAG